MSLGRSFEGSVCLVLLLVNMMFLLLVTGCSGTMENDRGWDPGKSFVDRLGQSAWNAFANWQTVGPAVGAAIFQPFTAMKPPGSCKASARALHQ